LLGNPWKFIGIAPAGAKVTRKSRLELARPLQRETRGLLTALEPPVHVC
jgi:hypothetical protein